MMTSNSQDDTFYQRELKYDKFDRGNTETMLIFNNYFDECSSLNTFCIFECILIDVGPNTFERVKSRGTTLKINT